MEFFRLLKTPRYKYLVLVVGYNNKEMGFGKLKVKCRMRGARGTADANSIFRAVIDSWKDLNEAVGNLSEEE